MNKVYKIKKNQRGLTVVCGELAKSATKGMVVGLVALMSNVALAANHHGEWIGGFGVPSQGMGTIFNSDTWVQNGVFGQGGLALGDGGVLTSGWNSVAIGQGSVIANLSEADFKKYTQLVVAANNRGDGDYSQAINFAKSKVQNSNDSQQANSVALGVNNLANGSGTFILGRYNRVISSGVNLDSGYAYNSVLGSNNSLTSNNSSIIGNNNRISGATNIFAMGNNINVSGSGFTNDVILGNYSAGANEVDTYKYYQGQAGNFAGGNAYAALSVGASGKERQIKNVAAGQISASSTDAINGSQLYYAVEYLKTQMGGGNNPDIKIEGDTGGKVSPGADNVISVAGGNNITTKTEGGKIVVDLDKDVNLGGNGSISAGGVTIDNTGIDAGGKVIDNVATPVDGNDAVNKDYVDNTNSKVTVGDNLGVTDSVGSKGEPIYNITLDDDIDLGTDGSITAGGVTVDNTGIDAGGKVIDNVATPVDGNDAVNKDYVDNTNSKVTVGDNLGVTDSIGENGEPIYNVTLDKDIDLGADGSLTIGDVVINDNGINGGGDKITNVAGPEADTDAANKKYVDDTNTKVTVGDNLGVTDSKGENGETIYNVTLDKDLDLGTDGSLTIGDVVINDNGINGGGDKITNVAGPEADTDAANKKYVDDTNTKVTVGDNLGVTDSKGENGETIYNVTLDKDLDLGTDGSITAGGVTVDEKGIDAGGKTVANVKDGEISDTSKEAVNGSQLKHVQDQVDSLQDLKADLSWVNKKFDVMNKKIDKMDKRLSNGIAAASAIAGLPQPTVAGASMFSGAASTYHGKKAMAIGYSRVSENNKHIIKLSVATGFGGNSSTTAVVGYGFQF